MGTTLVLERPDIQRHAVRSRLAVRLRPYWVRLENYNRMLGYQKLRHGTFWVARYRTTYQSYRQVRLGPADDTGSRNKSASMTFNQAREAATKWFRDPEQLRLASEARRRHPNEHLSICPIGDEFTIGHALHDYVEWKRLAAAKSNFGPLVSLINYHIVPKLASLPAKAFTSEVARLFIRDVLETPPRRGNQPPPDYKLSLDQLNAEELRKRKKTANSCLVILRVALRMAWEAGKLESERPWRLIKLFPRTTAARNLHLSRAECQRLLAHCRPDVGRLVLAALYTGCRMGELLEMRCNHVGRDGYGVYVPPQKTWRPRFVFLPDEGMIWFLKLIEGRRPDDFVFLNDNTGRRMGPSNKLFRKALIEAELPVDFTFHGLRHTYASQLVQAGAPMLAVAEQLGHLTARTVMETYGHLAPQIRESEVRQRFTALSKTNVRRASREREKLRTWRISLKGSDWRTYARITDLRSKANSVDRIPLR
jgi:integrase